jgi:hypothetical protein
MHFLRDVSDGLPRSGDKKKDIPANHPPFLRMYSLSILFAQIDIE